MSCRDSKFSRKHKAFFFFIVSGEEKQTDRLTKSKYPPQESTQSLEKVAGDDSSFGRKWRGGTVAELQPTEREICTPSSIQPVLHYHCFAQFDHCY